MSREREAVCGAVVDGGWGVGPRTCPSNMKVEAGGRLNCTRTSALRSSSALPALRMKGTPSHL